jgi:tryptophanyl-tRNA synthetase
MTENYKNVNRDFGYGHAKQALFELIVEKFKTERENTITTWLTSQKLTKPLFAGAEKARAIANGVLARVRGKLGFENSYEAIGRTERARWPRTIFPAMAARRL